MVKTLVVLSVIVAVRFMAGPVTQTLLTSYQTIRLNVQYLLHGKNASTPATATTITTRRHHHLGNYEDVLEI